MKPGVTSVQAVLLSCEKFIIVVRKDNPVVLRGKPTVWLSRKVFESRRRQGESRGHHRSPRAGNVHTGVVWELERTANSLWWNTGNGKPEYKSSQASDGRHRARRRAERNTKNGCTQGIGDRAKAKRTEKVKR